MELAYEKYALMFKALSDETRLKIVDMLSCGELCACEILASLSISQSTLSYHMKLLADVGLVNVARDGVWMRYTLNLASRDELAALLLNVTSAKETCICHLGKIAVCCEESEAAVTKKEVRIEFLYLDLSVCERCQGAQNNLDAALRQVSAVLQSAGYKVSVEKIHITSPELAVKYEFLSSPTIRVNGHDIALDVKETTCQSCGDLCGGETQCRSWVYEGQEYEEPPKELIVNGILQAVFGNGRTAVRAVRQPYLLPENLAAFFAGVAEKKSK